MSTYVALVVAKMVRPGAAQDSGDLSAEAYRIINKDCRRLGARETTDELELLAAEVAAQTETFWVQIGVTAGGVFSPTNFSLPDIPEQGDRIMLDVEKVPRRCCLPTKSANNSWVLGPARGVVRKEQPLKVLATDSVDLSATEKIHWAHVKLA